MPLLLHASARTRSHNNRNKWLCAGEQESIPSDLSPPRSSTKNRGLLLCVVASLLYLTPGPVPPLLPPSSLPALSRPHAHILQADHHVAPHGHRRCGQDLALGRSKHWVRFPSPDAHAHDHPRHPHPLLPDPPRPPFSILPPPFPLVMCRHRWNHC